MSNSLKLRLLSGVWLAAISFWIIALGGLTFRIAILLVLGVAAVEWSRLALTGLASRIFMWLAFACVWVFHFGVLTPHGFLLHWYPYASYVCGAVWLLCVIASIFFAKNKNSTYAVYSRITQAIGVVYLSLALLSLLWLRLYHNGINLFMFVVIMVVATDVCAYFGGRKFGGKKLAPMISPNKTWSGALIGGVSAMILGGIFGHYTLPELAPTVLIALCFSVTCISQVGDLFISLLKRVVGLKDTGALIPGHGGVLDRFDGLFPAMIITAFTFFLMHVVDYWLLLPLYK